MYGMSDEVYGQSEKIMELERIIVICQKYIRKLPNKNAIEKEIILNLIEKELR
jgi:hypothetical protein